MSIMELGALGEFLGVFAVVATLAYLALQIRQNTGITRAQINQARADIGLRGAMSVYNSEYLPQILIKVNRDDVLTEEEMERYRYWFQAINRSQDNNLRQYSEGFLGEQMPRDISRMVRRVVAGSQTSRDEWAASKQVYS